MLAIQNPLKEVTDRYTINLKQSNTVGDSLYKKTSRIERITVVTRFLVSLVVVGLLLLPIVVVLATIYAWLVVTGIYLEFQEGLMGMAGLASGAPNSSVATFGVQIMNFLFQGLFVVWIGFSGYTALRNITNSEQVKKEKVQGRREVAWALGAREYSTDEAEKLSAALEQILQRSKTAVNVHSDWWIVDSSLSHAVTLGSDLYITTGAIKSDYLVPILAHEFGHIANNDGLTLASLRNFISPYLLFRLTNFANLNKGVIVTQKTIEDMKGLAISLNIKGFGVSLNNELGFLLYSLWFGGLGVMRYSSEWAQWFRERDYLADDYVYNLGLGEQLKDYLQNNPQFGVAMPYSNNWTAFTELRLDRTKLLGSLP